MTIKEWFMIRKNRLLLLLSFTLTPLAVHAAHWQDASTINWSAARAHSSLMDDAITFRSRQAPSLQAVNARSSGHERKDEYFHGIRVLGGEIVEHTAPAAGVPAVTGRVLQQIALDKLTPDLDAAQAASLAKARYPALGAVRQWQSELVVTLWQQQARLAYRISFLGLLAGKPVRPTLLLDAHSGEVLLDEPLKALEDEFGERFVRIHRNALVSRERIERLQRTPLGHFQLFLRGMESEALTVSRRHVAGVRKLMHHL